jgi:hypothetical protein
MKATIFLLQTHYATHSDPDSRPARLRQIHPCENLARSASGSGHVFENAQGEYHYRPALISKAHEWCQRECERALAQGNSVVVANTFVRHWEMTAYKNLARKYRARLVTKVCRGDFPNVHGVDSVTIERMRQKWQD